MIVVFAVPLVIPLTLSSVMWVEEHLWNLIVLQKSASFQFCLSSNCPVLFTLLYTALLKGLAEETFVFMLSSIQQYRALQPYSFCSHLSLGMWPLPALLQHDSFLCLHFRFYLIVMF